MILMSKFINIAAVHFEINAERGATDAQAKVLEQFKYAVAGSIKLKDDGKVYNALG